MICIYRKPDLKTKKKCNNLIIFIIAVIVLVSLACGSSTTSTSRSATATQPTRGWLCDYDGTGSIRLWTDASMQATVKDVVGTCVNCCVDVTLTDQNLVSGILFYHIRVGSQSGWVDVDYFYRSKPSWSSN
jgi:hypothetical protein